VKKDFRDVIGVRNPVAIGALAVLGMVTTVVVLYAVYLTVWLYVRTDAFGSTVDMERMEDALVRDYEALRTVADYFIFLGYSEAYIRVSEHTDIRVLDVGYRIEVSDDEVLNAMKTLRKYGSWRMGKHNNGVYFRRGAGAFGGMQFVYWLSGSVPDDIRGVRLGDSNWSYSHLGRVSEQDMQDMQGTLDHYYELFFIVVNYFAEIEYRRVMTLDEITEIYVSHEGRVQIQDDEARDAFEVLRRRRYRSIRRQDDVIIFNYSRGRYTYHGIIYSIDGVSPNDKTNFEYQILLSSRHPTQIITYLTQLEPLSKQSWFYYERDVASGRTVHRPTN